MCKEERTYHSRVQGGRVTVKQDEPRLFYLLRRTDVSGVSGTGKVADGVEFPDGSVALRWRSKFASTAVYDSIELVEAIHGHDGSTSIHYTD